jgi:hypothetical protein
LYQQKGNTNWLKIKIMKSITKQQVITKLVSRGNSLEEATKMTELHFDYAVKTYSKLSAVCECIRTIY